MDVALLSAALDAAGSSHDQPVLVVAGFISTAEQWVEFDCEWTHRLKQDGIECFHANEFANSRGQFKGWRDQESRRRKLSADLMGIIQNNVHRKVGEVIANKILEGNVSQENRKAFYIEAFPVAGRTAVKTVYNYASSVGHPHRPEIIFEDGDRYRGKLRNLMVDHGYPEPIFRPKKDRIEKDGSITPRYSPLQAADWIAYEIFTVCKRRDLDGHLSHERWAFQQFNKMPGEFGMYSEADMTRLNKMVTEYLKTGRIIEPGTGGRRDETEFKAR
jgi:hypothetical protein